MFSAWCGPASRPTMDIDLLGRIDSRIDTITTVMKDACLTDVEPDGISFNAETVEAVRITEDAEYGGIRVRVRGSLGKIRVSIQIDSRMKDFYDIWFLSHPFDFKGVVLGEAIEKTFEKRNTPVNLEAALFDIGWFVMEITGIDGRSNCGLVSTYS